MIPNSPIHSLLATARIANVPSVVSNLGLGILLGCISKSPSFQWPWALCFAAIFFYVGGNFLNDWKDRDWDLNHRPERGLPSGLFSARSFLWTAIFLFMGGMVISAFYGWLAFLVSGMLICLIVWYTKIHKQTAFSVMPMGLCRACLPVLGYVSMRGGLAGPVLFPSLALLIYIVSLSLCARYEALGNISMGKKNQARALLLAAALISAMLPLWISPAIGWIGLVPFIIWILLSFTRFQSPVSVHVSALLAGIPLLDFVILLPMALIWLRLGRVDVGDTMFLTALLLPPIAFVAGRLLQRLAPAT